MATINLWTVPFDYWEGHYISFNGKRRKIKSYNLSTRTLIYIIPWYERLWTRLRRWLP